uniref:Uncharacterized protein n=1 Tax=Brassica oleracea var. oleracea TaxID=109376 RepID=A0A0D3BEA7_BRAOL
MTKIPRDFRGKLNFRGVISEDLFCRYVVGITLFRRHNDDFFPQYVAVQDEDSQLQTEDDASTASTNLSRFRINEIVESIKKALGFLVHQGNHQKEKVKEEKIKWNCIQAWIKVSVSIFFRNVHYKKTLTY